ncbi:MAG: hypothetical protein SGARI_004600 [Bacillariaceae sp.]
MDEQGTNEAKCRQALWSCMKLAGDSKEEMDRFKTTHLEMGSGEGQNGTMEAGYSPDIVSIFTPDRLARTNAEMLKGVATRKLFGQKNGASSNVPQAWMKNFLKLKAFYIKCGHLSTQSKPLKTWMAFQRDNANTLSSAQLQLLESIHFEAVTRVSINREQLWNKQFLALKTTLASKEKMPKAVSDWLSTQRKKARLGQLSKDRQMLLEGLNVSLRRQREKTPSARTEDAACYFV